MAARMAHAQGHQRPLAWLLWLAATAMAIVSSGPLRAHDFAESLVKIRAVAADGSKSVGSGVVIAADLLATACHVTREAKTIEVAHGAKRWVAKVESGSLTHDLCLISVTELGLPAVAIRTSESLRLGERVVAAGFPGGGDLSVREGVVEGLYRFD